MIKKMTKILIFYILVVWIKSKLIIQSPASLKQYFVDKYKQKPDGIPYSLANFGDIPYGRNIIGQLTTPTVLQNCIYEDIPNLNKTKKIILSERDDCKFTQKALNTQKQGGIMSIIMDSVVQNPGRVIMVDDGHGSQIHIPTVLISKQDGQKILQTMSNETVSISIYFDTLKADYVTMNLYLDITDRNNFVFLRRFKSQFQKISKYVKMSINYATIPCRNCPDGDCYYNGTFCKKILYGWMQNTGQIFIQQQLREYFIYQQNPDKWWDYMDKFDQYCSQTTQQAYLQQCSINTMKTLDIDSVKIIQLVKNSFEAETNPVLMKSNDQRNFAQIMYYPSVVVNNLTYRGNLEAYEVKQMICNSLRTLPDQCIDQPFEPKSEHIILWIALSVFGFLLLLVFIILCYRRMVRRQLSNNMNKQVNELVNQYITMYEADKFKGDNELNSKVNEEQ